MSVYLEKWKEIRHSREYYGEFLPFLIFFFFFVSIFPQKKLLVQWNLQRIVCVEKRKLNAENSKFASRGEERKRKYNDIGEKHLIPTEIFLLSSRNAGGANKGNNGELID